jgi:hypothetical protein
MNPFSTNAVARVTESSTVNPVVLLAASAAIQQPCRHPKVFLPGVAEDPQDGAECCAMGCGYIGRFEIPPGMLKNEIWLVRGTALIMELQDRPELLNPIMLRRLFKRFVSVASTA